jgi:hypothetical protein
MVSMEAAQQASASSFVVGSRLACTTIMRDTLHLWLRTHVMSMESATNTNRNGRKVKQAPQNPKYETGSQAVEASE